MKESNFYSDDFEQLIRDKTEQYKMYPSENVWKGVHNSLHTKRKWFIGSMAALVTGILFLAGRELITPSVHPVAVRKTAPAASSMGDLTKSSAPAVTLHNPLAAFRSVTSSPGSRHVAGAGDAGEEQDPVYRGTIITVSNPVLSQSDLSEWLSQVVRLPEHAPDIAVIGSKNVLAEQWRAAEDGSRPPEIAKASGEVVVGHRETAEGQGAKDEGDDVRNVLESLSAAGTSGRLSRPGSRAIESTGSGRGSVTGKDVAGARESSAKADAATIAEADDMQRVNWLREYAMNVLTPPTKRGRTFLQLSLAPTLNYRTLGGADPAAEKFGMNFPGSMSESRGFGFEVGGSVLYRLTRNLSVKGGLQFNFIRYQMGAYSTLNNTYLTPQGYSLDTSRRMSLPATATMLDNDYYQLSAPIGFELRVLGNERLQLHLGGTFQPSYLLNTTAYTVNHDLTQYDKQPWMFRKWNFSVGAEAFITYRVGNIRWQLGPEFRYQLLSSYTSQTPITENLKSYGIKFGITKPLP